MMSDRPRLRPMRCAGVGGASSSYEILRVINNNVVLVRPQKGREGSERILTGRGIGFQARPGQKVDPEKIVKVFAPADGRDPDHMAELVAAIPPEQIQIVSDALAEAGIDTSLASRTTLVIALADHITLASRRAKLGQHVEYPLRAEVEYLYADEYRSAVTLLNCINARLADILPPSEAVAITLHLVNAGFNTGDLSNTYTMTGIIQQMLTVIGQSYGRDMDSTSVNVARLITHLRYLFVRLHCNKQIVEQCSEVGEAIRLAYPDALSCAQKVAAIVELRLGSQLTSDEIAYLTLHIARVTSDDE